MRLLQEPEPGAPYGLPSVPAEKEEDRMAQQCIKGFVSKCQREYMGMAVGFHGPVPPSKGDAESWHRNDDCVYCWLIHLAIQKGGGSTHIHSLHSERLTMVPQSNSSIS